MMVKPVKAVKLVAGLWFVATFRIFKGFVADWAFCFEPTNHNPLLNIKYARIIGVNISNTAKIIFKTILISIHTPLRFSIINRYLAILLFQIAGFFI